MGLQRAARAANARADPTFRAACSQGVIADQPDAPGRAGERKMGRWELCSPGLVISWKRLDYLLSHGLVTPSSALATTTIGTIEANPI